MSNPKKSYMNVIMVAIFAMALMVILVPAQASGAVVTTVDVTEADNFNVVTGDTMTVMVNITGGTSITSCQVALFDADGALIDKIWSNQTAHTYFDDAFVFEGLTNGMVNVMVYSTDDGTTEMLTSGIYEVVVQSMVPTGITSWTDGYNIVLFAILFIVILCILLLLLKGQQVKKDQMKYVIVMAVIAFLVTGFIYLLIGGTLTNIYNWLVGLF